jgi:uncharacterized protein YjiS (DUF1127 family)
MIEFLRDTIARRRTYHRIRNELSQHNHRELYDLRISSADIDHIAWEGAYGARASDGRCGAAGSSKGRGGFSDVR